MDGDHSWAMGVAVLGQERPRLTWYDRDTACHCALGRDWALPRLTFGVDCPPGRCVATVGDHPYSQWTLGSFAAGSKQWNGWEGKGTPRPLHEM